MNISKVRSFLIRIANSAEVPEHLSDEANDLLDPIIKVGFEECPECRGMNTCKRCYGIGTIKVGEE